MALPRSTWDKLAAADDARATADEQAEAQALTLAQRATIRSQNAKMKQNQAFGNRGGGFAPVGYAGFGSPDGIDWGTFWDNNARLSQIAGLSEGGVSRPVGAQIKGSGNTIGGSMSPFDSLRSFTSAGNVNAGPSSLERDLGAETLQNARLRNFEAAKSPQQRTSEAVAQQEALGRSRIGLNTEALKQSALDYFDPDVQAMNRAEDASTVENLNARYVLPAQLKAEGQAEAERLKAEGVIRSQQARSAAARFGQIVSAMRGAAGTTPFNPQQQQMVTELWSLLQAMGGQEEMFPRGLVPGTAR